MHKDFDALQQAEIPTLNIEYNHVAQIDFVSEYFTLRVVAIAARFCKDWYYDN